MESNNAKDNDKKAKTVKQRSLFTLLIYNTFLFMVLFALVAVGSYWMLKNYIKSSEVEVPNICGLTTAEALEVLEPLKLYVKLGKKSYDDLYDEGYIISQHPLPGRKVKIDSVLNITMSMGSEFVNVPDISGKDVINAGVALRKARLNIGEKTYFPSQDMPRDGIITQFPEAGQKTAVDTPVNVLVSSGPKIEYYAMPNLSEKTLEEAKLLLNSYGILLSDINRKRNTDVEEGVIFSQSPLSGLKVARGEKVKVTVSMGHYGAP